MSLSVRAIVRRDQLAGLMIRAIIALWLFWIGFVLMGGIGGEGTQIIVAYAGPRMLIASAVGSLILVPVSFWRISMIRRVFRVGARVQGEVTDIVVRQGIHQVWYRYEWEGKTYMGRNLVKQGTGFVPVEVGQTTEIVLRADRPDRSFVSAFFQ